MPHANHLKWRTRRIRQWAEQIERRVHAQFTSHLRNARRCLVKSRREDETDAVLVETTLDDLRRSGGVDPEYLEEVGTAAARRCRTRTMLRHRQTSAGNDECRRRGNIERLYRAGASSGSVDEPPIAGADWNRACAHRRSHAGELFCSFALCRQCNQRRCDLRIRRPWIKQRGKKLFRVRAIKIFTPNQTQCRAAQCRIALGNGASHVTSDAMAKAFAIARALFTVSSYSRCGSESATIPAPAWKYALPFFRTAERSAMQESRLPSNPI